jgi:hypothetical protein
MERDPECGECHVSFDIVSSWEESWLIIQFSFGFGMIELLGTKFETISN